MLKITRISSPDAPVTRLRVEGRIVLRTASEVEAACRAALDDGPPLLLDLSGVAFVDADGAAALTALQRRSITLVGCSPFIASLIRSHGERGDEPPPADGRSNDAPNSFADLVRRAGPPLLAFARRLFASEADACDAVRAAFGACDETASSASIATHAAALQRRVALSACTQVRDRREVDLAAIAPLLPRFDDTGHWVGGVAPLVLPERVGAESRARTAIERALGRLPAWFRTIAVLRDGVRVDDDEVATLLAVTGPVVRADLDRARRALRALLVDELAAADVVGAAVSA